MPSQDLFNKVTMSMRRRHQDTVRQLLKKIRALQVENRDLVLSLHPELARIEASWEGSDSFTN